MKTNNNEMQIITKKDKIIVIVGDAEYELHYSFRIYIMYETITGHNLDFNNINATDLLLLLYSSVLSTLQYNKVEHTMKYEDFMNMIDDCGGEYLLTSFANWFINKMKQQAELLQANDEDKEDKKKSLKRTKKETTKNS